MCSEDDSQPGGLSVLRGRKFTNTQGHHSHLGTKLRLLGFFGIFWRGEVTARMSLHKEALDGTHFCGNTPIGCCTPRKEVSLRCQCVTHSVKCTFASPTAILSRYQRAMSRLTLNAYDYSEEWPLVAAEVPPYDFTRRSFI